jgi:hypothetical protein
VNLQQRQNGLCPEFIGKHGECTAVAASLILLAGTPMALASLIW